MFEPHEVTAFRDTSYQFWAFFEILDFFKNKPPDHVQYVLISNYTKRNSYKLQYHSWILRFSKKCPKFDCLFLWNRSTKNVKNFIIEHYFEIEFKIKKARMSNLDRTGFSFFKRAKKSNFQTLCTVYILLVSKSWTLWKDFWYWLIKKYFIKRANLDRKSVV